MAPKKLNDTSLQVKMPRKQYRALVRYSAGINRSLSQVCREWLQQMLDQAQGEVKS